MLKNLLALSLFFLANQTVYGIEYQAGMDVFLYQINHATDGKVKLKLIKNISNKQGYDNQPSFSPDNKKVLYTSARKNNQTDIFQYDIVSNKTIQLTDTAESEYSAMMQADNKTLTAVREGGSPYQSVHRYSTVTGKSSWAVNANVPIGYYAFNDNGVAAAWARWSYAIYLIKPNAEHADFVIGHAPASKPHLIPGKNFFSFVHRQADDTLWIKSLDPNTKSITLITEVINQNIDYAWTAKQEIIMGNDQKLMIFKQEKTGWQEWADLSKDGIGKISRLAVSDDYQYLAVVARVIIN